MKIGHFCHYLHFLSMNYNFFKKEWYEVMDYLVCIAFYTFSMILWPLKTLFQGVTMVKNVKLVIFLHKLLFFQERVIWRDGLSDLKGVSYIFKWFYSHMFFLFWYFCLWLRNFEIFTLFTVHPGSDHFSFACSIKKCYGAHILGKIFAFLA